MNNWYVYILRCADNTLYTGVTTDAPRRIRQHNGELIGGAKYTAVRRPVEMVFYSEHTSRSEACKEESRIKSLTRKEKCNLIEEEK